MIGQSTQHEMMEDNYYTEHERRLLEEPRPQPKDDEIEVKFTWRRGDLLGSGAYGTVYLALNSDEGNLIAAKQVIIHTIQVFTENLTSDFVSRSH